MTARSTTLAVALVLTGASGLAACAPAEAAPDTVTVHAAASLTDAFADLEALFEQRHPGVDAVMVHGGSTALAAAIREGAPADVFAAADERRLQDVASDHAAPPSVIATNTLAMIVADGNPRDLEGLADLGRADVASVVCAPVVPCGDATARLAAAMGVALSPSSEESSVTAVLGSVAAGQADAGVVYTTDVARAEGIEEVPLQGAETVRTTYAIAPLTAGGAPGLGKAFVDLVRSDAGRAVLASHGFARP